MRSREPEAHSEAARVTAAAEGDREALEALVADYLPLIYNIVGRAMDGHPDVDDVVQETMLRAVKSLSALREPERFRSWLVAIAVRQVRDSWQARQTRPRVGLPADATAQADPQADFADLTILRLDLSGQRREAVEATRWLEEADRETLSLWWMEAAGQLSRSDWAAADGLDPHQAAVRVARVKERLEVARSVLRALASSPRCPELTTLLPSWDGRPSALWRKRLNRHVRDCPYCWSARGGLMPAEGLLGRLALVPLPLGLGAHLVAGSLAGVHGGAAAVKAEGLFSGSRQAVRAAGQAHGPAAVVTSGVLALAGVGLWYGLTVQSAPEGAPEARPRSATASVSASAPAPAASPPPSTPSTTTPPAPSVSPTATPTITPVSGMLGPHALEAAVEPGRYIAGVDGRAAMKTAREGISLASQRLVFTVTRGLMGTGCYSFRDTSGAYLRHTGYHEGRVEMDMNDGSARFRADATYCVRGGAMEGSKSLFAFNSPLSHLRYRNDGELWLEAQEGADSGYGRTTSFNFVTP
ncbi:sigma-70 family RNA polymerase sigma factor [Streptomyces sp. NBC_00059]|uniref:sigma-70 family RNA polymerase sigma factor n=1 Tax=unclassified Streptomyces TaxID=2593676 RepID=UPI002250B913|nr:sigma-70 family RNA polymerase sigma factor [Streptomyces sp. NBC_00059]MCX5415940.1 sigma-70 family RNA polymerase sigma factor [Streptomyces sp. NBC_00059]